MQQVRFVKERLQHEAEMMLHPFHPMISFLWLIVGGGGYTYIPTSIIHMHR